jgi:predicted nucleotide-binding protein (sugar kinase/HSP70/actin superfamily)
MSREEIVSRFVYYTAGGCGPCRFGMYESEYRHALDNAGFHGFRVLTFNSNKVIFTGSEEPGLKYTLDFGIGMLNALLIGDLLFDAVHAIRPWEMNPGETDRVFDEVLGDIATFLSTRPLREAELPAWANARKPVRIPLNVLHKIREHLHGRDWLALLERVRRKLAAIEVDRTRPRPLVKITGEFFSAISESDANYRMFRFLEAEGAEVAVEPISALVLYWLRQARLNNQRKRRLQPSASFYKKEAMLGASECYWRYQYARYRRLLGNVGHGLIPQDELVPLARDFYEPLTRGGEGYLEVAKSLYVERHRSAHLVLSLKPFGCMPSTQSDGVMASVAAKCPGLLFLAVETSGEGEINALSRVQMALGDARRRAREEFDEAVSATGRSLTDIRAWVARHPEVRGALYPVPHWPRVAGTAARFIHHVGHLMRRERS